MTSKAPDLTIRYRLAAPGEDLVPDRMAEVFASPQDAWRVAAQRTLDPEFPENPENPDRVLVARALLDVNDCDVRWGWRVQQWANTLTVDARDAKLGDAWTESLSVQNRGVLLGTYGKLATTLVEDLIEDGPGLHLAIRANDLLIIGIVSRLDDDVVTFTDEVSTSVIESDWIAAIYR